MTNELYLYLSYFSMIAIGLAAAVGIALLLHQPLCRALSSIKQNRMYTIIKRCFPTWLITAVVLGFLSVSYIDCGHDTYAKIIAERSYLIDKTQDQISAMSYFLAIALILCGFLMIPILWAGMKRNRKINSLKCPAAANRDGHE